MTLHSRLTEIERRRESPDYVPAIVHRLEGETIEQCIARTKPTGPAYVFPPAEPRDENGELAANLIAGCVLWTGERIERVGPKFDPRTCDPGLYDPDPNIR